MSKRIERKARTRVVVFVDGGNVQEVYSNDLGIDVEIVDFDNLEAEGKWSDERHEILDRATEGLDPVPF